MLLPIAMSPRLQMPIVLCNHDIARENLKRLPQSHRHRFTSRALFFTSLSLPCILFSLTLSALESRSRHELVVKVRMAHEIIITEMTNNAPRLSHYASHSSSETESY